MFTVVIAAPHVDKQCHAHWDTRLLGVILVHSFYSFSVVSISGERCVNSYIQSRYKKGIRAVLLKQSTPTPARAPRRGPAQNTRQSQLQRRSSTGRSEMKTRKNNEYETAARNKRDNFIQSNCNIMAVNFILVWVDGIQHPSSVSVTMIS